METPTKDPLARGIVSRKNGAATTKRWQIGVPAWKPLEAFVWALPILKPFAVTKGRYYGTGIQFRLGGRQININCGQGIDFDDFKGPHGGPFPTTDEAIAWFTHTLGTTGDDPW